MVATGASVNALPGGGAAFSGPTRQLRGINRDEGSRPSVHAVWKCPQGRAAAGKARSDGRPEATPIEGARRRRVRATARREASGEATPTKATCAPGGALASGGAAGGEHTRQQHVAACAAERRTQAHASGTRLHAERAADKSSGGERPGAPPVGCTRRRRVRATASPGSSGVSTHTMATGAAVATLKAGVAVGSRHARRQGGDTRAAGRRHVARVDPHGQGAAAKANRRGRPRTPSRLSQTAAKARAAEKYLKAAVRCGPSHQQR